MFLLLQINVTSSPMTCYIFYSQVIMLATTPYGKNQLLENDTNFFQSNFDVVTYTLYGMWNLDYFAIHYPHFVLAIN